jgi:hypothetical protein
MIYADTSFLASLYLPDRQTGPQALAYAEQNKPCLPFMFLHWPELARAVWTTPAAKAVWELIKADLAGGVKLKRHELDALRVGQRAAGMMRHYLSKWASLRSLDVMHVSCAIEMQARCFLSFDWNSSQRVLAHTQGLKVWPELKPEEVARI